MTTYNLFSGNMTDNTAPSGFVAHAQHESNPEKAYRAFDGVLTAANYWFSQDGSSPGCPERIYYQTPVSHILNQYSMRTLDVGSTYYPHQWTCDGSNDGSSWTQIDAPSAINMVDNTTYTYNSFSVPSAYTYHSINITSTDNGTTNHVMALTEISFYEAPVATAPSTPDPLPHGFGLGQGQGLQGLGRGFKS